MCTKKRKGGFFLNNTKILLFFFLEYFLMAWMYKTPAYSTIGWPFFNSVVSIVC